MKAFVYRDYGTAEVLRLEEVEKPTPEDNDVLVKVKGISINVGDWYTMTGKPYLVRLSAGLMKPKNSIIGNDIAGEVVAVGRHVTKFQPGDAVYGESGYGAFAEYVAVNEDKLGLKPTNLSFEEAAAVPVAASTALLGVRASSGLKPGQKVLINGASGGVGTYVVQIAKSFGVEVTAVCSSN